LQAGLAKSFCRLVDGPEKTHGGSCQNTTEIRHCPKINSGFRERLQSKDSADFLGIRPGVAASISLSGSKKEEIRERPDDFERLNAIEKVRDAPDPFRSWANPAPDKG
jgi:hypothetical protein